MVRPDTGWCDPGCRPSTKSPSTHPKSSQSPTTPRIVPHRITRRHTPATRHPLRRAHRAAMPLQQGLLGGERGIRTPGALASSTVFKYDSLTCANTSGECVLPGPNALRASVPMTVKPHCRPFLTPASGTTVARIRPRSVDSDHESLPAMFAVDCPVLPAEERQTLMMSIPSERALSARTPVAFCGSPT